jgi:predicted RNase H-like nuclease (RuvC/YqgF family)
MTLPQPSPDSASKHDSDQSLLEAQAFEQELATIERSLHDLKERYTQVQQDEQTQAQLQERQEQLKRQMRRSPTAQLKAELKQLQTQLDELEVNLESHLFSWGSLREPFWQIIRFGGLGIVIGWSIAFAVLQSPNPSPRPPFPAPQSPQLEK